MIRVVEKAFEFDEVAIIGEWFPIYVLIETDKYDFNKT
jgi:hypothetical protein